MKNPRNQQSLPDLPPKQTKAQLQKLELERQARKNDVHDHPLFEHLVDAVEQAMFGKGERHGGAQVDFMDQPWRHYVKMHGRGFLTGQAAKKLEEAASSRTGEAFRTEVLGAIVYAGMALIYESEQAEEEVA